MTRTVNQLAEALSPYLQQHRDNPVHWYTWDREAFGLARELDRPVLLSIGYSACHWCHVMAHESFEDADIAARMNADFINIKVDREERPDLDRIYQLSHQLLTGRGGGWPLTVFLDPTDQAPFFAGTYFPATPRGGMITFPDLLDRIARVWRDRRDDLNAQNERVKQALDEINAAAPAESIPDISLCDRFIGQLEAGFDPEHGGFGGAPKFPQGPVLDTLARLTVHRRRDDARALLFETLQAIAASGLHDHLAGGFFRYCVDDRWEIPHFEKMLYDNVQLLPVLAEAGRAWDHPAMQDAARGIVTWLDAEMLTGEGGLASSLDADSPAMTTDDPVHAAATPGGEGAFYLWTREGIDATLDADEATLFRARFGLDQPPNFEGRAWHLRTHRALADLGEPTEVDQALDRSRHRLLELRRQRPAPDRDDKILAGWNGLAAAGLARAARALEEPAWHERAVSVLECLAGRHFATDPPRASWRNGRGAHTPCLDDLAGVMTGCLEVMHAGVEPRWLRLAERLAERILDRYTDSVSGALYMTARDAEQLVTRPRSDADDAAPSGAALTLSGWIHLGHLTGNPDWLTSAERALASLVDPMRRVPTAHAGLYAALLAWHEPLPQVLVGGADDKAESWFQELSGRPGVEAWRVRPEHADDLPGPLAAVASFESATAVLCRGMTCLEPVTEPAALDQQLANP